MRAHVATVYVDPMLYVVASMSVGVALIMAAAPKHQSDFIIFWDAVRWQLAGHDLYTAPYRAGWIGVRPNLAAPVLLILTVPFTLLPVHVAHAIWTGFGVVCYALSALWIGRELDLPVGRILAILLICPATVFGLSSGSFAPPLTLAVTRAWLEHRQGRDVASGLWMGAALFCKPFLLPFLGYAVIRRYWRLFAGLLGGIALALVGGGLVFGLSNTVLWVQTLKTVPEGSIGLSANGAWMGSLTRAGLSGSTRAAWWLAGSLMIAAVLFWMWRRAAANRDAEWLATMTGGYLASPASWEYYAPLLVAPVAANGSPLRWIGYALFCLPFTTLQVAADPASPLAWRLTVGSAHFWGYLAFFVANFGPSSLTSASRIGSASDRAFPPDSDDRRANGELESQSDGR